MTLQQRPRPPLPDIVRPVVGAVAEDEAAIGGVVLTGVGVCRQLHEGFADDAVSLRGVGVGTVGGGGVGDSAIVVGGVLVGADVVTRLPSPVRLTLPLPVPLPFLLLAPPSPPYSVLRLPPPSVQIPGTLPFAILNSPIFPLASPTDAGLSCGKVDHSVVVHSAGVIGQLVPNPINDPGTVIPRLPSMLEPARGELGTAGSVVESNRGVIIGAVDHIAPGADRSRQIQADSVVGGSDSSRSLQLLTHG